MDSSTEEMSYCRGTLLALLDFLVDPLLPSNIKLREPISISEQESVAKQVHAVVLLYNYYHRKQNPGLAFLDSRSFCKLAVDLKPSLHLYFRVAQQTDSTELKEKDEDLTSTEKAILSACDTSLSLNASKNDPIIDGWPISKVAVFLVDTQKENCVLFHSSITKGVWSMIEKEVNATNQELVALSANKKTRVMKRMDATGLHQLAYLAVKETCGINQGDLKILDNRIVYSTSKPHTAAQLYIMQCTQINQNMNLVPINDVMQSLQGSLIDEESVTPVVEHFHLLPYAVKLSEWLKRKMSQDSSQNSNMIMEVGNFKSSPSNMDKLVDPSYHVESVNITESSSRFQLKYETTPDIPERNSTILKSIETEEARIDSSYHLKEEPIAVDVNHCEASEARNHNGHHIEEIFVVVAPKHGEASEARIGNSQPLKEESFLHASQPSEKQAEFQNPKSFHSNKILPPCNSRQPESDKGVQNPSDCRRKEHPTEPVVYTKRNRWQKNNTHNKISCTLSNEQADYPRQETKQGGATGLSNSMDINGKRSINPCEDVYDQKLMVSVQETDQAALPGQNIGVITDIAMSEDTGKQDGAFVPFGSDFEHLRNLQLTIASRDASLSKNSLKVLLGKREQLSQKLRNIADEFALCEANIQNILRGGSEDQSGVMIDTLVNGCNGVSLQTAVGARENATLHYNYLDLSPVLKRKKLSEANMTVLSPCQELDGICNINFWMLPTYILSPVEGGFQATVNVKGIDFDCSSQGAICTTPHEARNSAASEVMAELRSLAAVL